MEHTFSLHVPVSLLESRISKCGVVSCTMPVDFSKVKELAPRVDAGTTVGTQSIHTYTPCLRRIETL
eukprot:249464-Amphidinium_carterae.1